MGVCADPRSYWWCQALSRSRLQSATNQNQTQQQQQQQQQPITHFTTIKDKTVRNRSTSTTETTIGCKYNSKSTNFIDNNKVKDISIASYKKSTQSRQQSNYHQHQHSSTLHQIRQSVITKINIIDSLQRHAWNSLRIFQLIILILIVLLPQHTTAHTSNNNNIPEDAVHITAILGEGVIFNCHVEFPNDHPVPYVLQWDKKGSDLPIYIWYESYPEHIEEGYKGRVSRVSQDSPFGSASLNLTNIKESDQGWYECKVVFLNRDPKQHKNGTWFHLDVHAPPRFSVTPEDIIYVNLGDSIILNCQADGTPTPEILWYKDANPVDPSPTVGIFNDGTELRISSIRHEDIGEYTCIARNGEGQVSHTARVIIAGGAVIMPTSKSVRLTQKTDEKRVLKALKTSGITVPPTNQTKLEGEKVMFSCEAKAMPGNVTVRWFREGSPVREVASLETRVTIRKDGSLIINPVSADDSGQYLCEVTNGIGDPQSASAYLNVEYPAKVTFTPTVQYLPFRLAGVVQCYIKSSPQLQYVTWTKDKRLLEPYQMKDIVVMANGSLLFTRVNEDHQGRYTCTPYNAQGTQGSSGPMEVLVRKPPTFTVEPESLYQRKVGDSVEMHCDAVEAEGTQRPTIKWQRQDGDQLSESQRSRVKIASGNITIENLRREDFGYYQCVVSNEVATLMSVTQLVIEGTQPHAPYNITGKATESSITLQWMPGYSGGSEYKQDYTIWYREAGVNDWQTISVTPSGSTQVTINGLASGTTYEFQVVGRNVLGDGMMSKVMTVRTLEDAPAAPRNVKAATQPPDHVFQLMPDEADLLAYFDIYFHTDSNGSIVYSPPKLKLKGPKPGPPRNLTVTEVSNGFLISWQAPLERAHIVKFYTIKYRTDAQWKTLNRGQIRPEETQYLVKNLVGGRTYYFRVLANSEKSYESSDEVKFPVPARVKHKAITAGVVGGILFFIVAIILSVCAVKICNKRKRRKQEKEFNMVACRITDARNIAAINNHTHLRSHSTGSISAGQVPLKKYKQARISSLTTILIAILHWIWPPDRCTNCHSIYSSPRLDDDATMETRRRYLAQIQRSVDGRFVMTVDDGVGVGDGEGGGGGGGGGVDEGDGGSDDRRRLTSAARGADDMHAIIYGDEVDGPTQQQQQQQRQRRRPSNASQQSSSDDGGFLARRNFLKSRASWRRPLVESPSQLSLTSAAGLLSELGGLLKLGVGARTDGEESLNGARYQNLPRYAQHQHHQQQQQQHQDHLLQQQRNIYRNLHSLAAPLQQAEQQTSAASRPLHINTISGGVPYTPSRVSRLFASSPTGSLLHGDGDGDGDGDLNGGSNVYGLDFGLLTSPWALATPGSGSHYHFCDLSSVYPSSAERSFPTPTATSGNLSRYRYYAHELPSLRTIQEETRRINQAQQQRHPHHQHHQQHQQPQLEDEVHGFVPLQMPSPPWWRSSYSQHAAAAAAGGAGGATAYHSYRPRTRWYPRHYSRLFGRSQSELLSPLPHLNLNLRSASAIGAAAGAMGLEASPESRSSSSGFGSKNTSNQPHGSHHSGSTSEWRLLPPYRPPPAPPPLSSAAAMPQQAQAQAPALLYSGSSYYSSGGSASLQRTITPPYTMDHWLDMITRLSDAGGGGGGSDAALLAQAHAHAHTLLPKSVDVGSVDGHYEFDPATPTPSASTPTVGLLRDELSLHIDTNALLSAASASASANTTANTIVRGDASHLRPSARYDDIEARLQAMKDEFYEYRRRQAMQRAGVTELESVC